MSCTEEFISIGWMNWEGNSFWSICASADMYKIAEKELDLNLKYQK